MKLSLFLLFGMLASLNSYAQEMPSSVLEQFLNQSQLTLLTLDQAQSLFDHAIKDRWIRMKDPGNGGRGGLCAQRAEEFEDWLSHKHSISSGKLLIGCGKDSIVGVDRVTRKTYRYSNYHEANLVLIETKDGHALFVMDTQFSDGPLPLQDYLATTIQGSAYTHYSEKRDEHMPYYESEPCRWFVTSGAVMSSQLDDGESQ